MTEHAHEWRLVHGGMVISTAPEQYPYECACGAFTHDPDSGRPCSICAPRDHQRRSTDLVALAGGPFDGKLVVRPINRSVTFRCDPVDQYAQKHVRYEQTEDRDVWAFRWNNWTVPFEEREPVPS